MDIIILTLWLLLPSAQEPYKRPPMEQKAPLGKTQEARLLGTIGFNDEPANDVITAPATVQVGEEFQITITTFGGGCERVGDTGVVVNEASATVMVYDFTTATHPGIACTMMLKRLPHTVTLRFTEPGEKLIQVWGRRVGGTTPLLGVPALLEQRVVVKAR